MDDSRASIPVGESILDMDTLEQGILMRILTPSAHIDDLDQLVEFNDNITIRLLMDSDQEIDSSLQRSIEQMDEEFESDANSHASSGQSSQQPEQDRNVNKDRKEKDNLKHHKKEKSSAYDLLLPPDEDVESVPPYVVVVQGSKSSGKSSLIRSLVKHYTKHNIDEIKGTITLRSNKKRRITIIQCPNDIRAMIDLSKIADVVLMIFDASLGFQMQSFEFLTLLKGHGFPHVMGVLNHLDYYKENKQLRKTKKKFKKRFEYEIGGNSKLFYLGKWDRGLYPKVETAKIGRYIGTANPPDVLWRRNHPFILADRWQPAEDRNYRKEELLDCEFYGYIRGASYRMNSKIHLVGVGDYLIKEVKVISDPCPEFQKVEENSFQENRESGAEQADSEPNEEKQDQAKREQMKAEITKKRKRKRTLAQNQRIVYAPACNLGTLSFQHTSGYVTIPHEYVKFTRKEKGQDESSSEEVEEGVQMMRDLQDMRQTVNDKLKTKQGNVQLFEGIEMEESDQDAIKVQEVSEQFTTKRQQVHKMKELTQRMLIPDPEQHNNLNREEDLSHIIYESKEKMITHDCSKFNPQAQPINNQHLKSFFMTSMDIDALHQMSDGSKDESADITEKKVQQSNFKKAVINQSSNFFKKGYYVKVTVEKMKYKDYLEIDHSMPVLLTRINLGEDSLGYVKANFKRHRWYSNLLKSNDPIIVSCGWRRYQTLITFAKEDPNDRLRFLKYTPGHDFCTGIFYGNFNQQNSGCVFTQTIKNDVKKFRIAGSAVVMEINKSFEVMKKVKLVGEPYKIMKNTAFIRGMFHSNIEVSNYIGAQIRTVSGIKGQIKKPVKEGGGGGFRATFEDKILISDIVFCRAWYRVQLERFYNPVLNFGKNRLMKTKYELRIEKGVEPTHKKDSEYKNIVRTPQTFSPFVVPKKLESNLPFKTKEKVKMSKREKIEKKENASMPKILMSDQSRDVAALIQRLNTIKNEKQAKKEEQFREKQRIKSAMQKPREEYYQQLKKKQKSEKMATLMRKKKKDEKRKAAETD